MSYILFVMLPALLLCGWASWRTRSTFKKYSRVPAARGFTGAQAAQVLLERAGIHDVQIRETQGFLSDHYNPMNKTLALSPDVYRSHSVAAVGVACHEAGHAIQHANAYKPLWIRSILVPSAGIGSNLGILVIFAGLLLNMAGLAMVGVLLFSAVVLFQLVTLPVEFDASNRAKKLALQFGLVTAEEQRGMSKVLNAAAMTYVAAAVSSIMTLLYYALIVAGISRD